MQVQNGQTPFIQLKPKARQATFAASTPISNDLFIRKTSAVHFAGKTQLTDFQKRGVLVIGANGTMGQGILQNARQGKFSVVAQDRNLNMAKAAIQQMEDKLSAAKGKFIKPNDYADIQTLTSADAIDGPRVMAETTQGGYAKGEVPEVALAVEAIFENLPMKQQLFRRLEELLPEDTILATNTSSLSVDDIAKDVKDKSRVIALHYFDPAISNKLIEIIRGKETSAETLEKTIAFSRAIGKVPVVVNHDSPGFAANRLLINVAVEALHLYEDGVGTADMIDDVASKLLWPHATGILAAQDKLMPPFVLFKKYGPMGVSIAKNLGKLGPYFKLSPALEAESERVAALRQGPLAQAQAELKELRPKYDKLIQQLAPAEAAASLDKLESLPIRKAIHESREQLKQIEAKVKKLEAEAMFFPKGFPPNELTGNHTEPERRQIIENRLLGALYGSQMQMVNEGLTTFEDLDTMTHLGFKWDVKPRSADEVQTALNSIRSRYGDTFKIPDIELKQPSFVKSSFNPKTGAQEIMLDRVQMYMGTENFHTLGTPTLKALKQAVLDANKDPKVKTIVIQSNGGHIFSGGANLNEVKGQKDASKVREYLDLGREVMDTIAASPKTTIAKVHGDAYGGGFELALACDRIVAADDVNFTLPEVNLGIFPGWGGTERLPERVGKPLAKALILGAKARFGLVNKFPLAMQKAINEKLQWNIDTPGGYRLDTATAKQMGLVYATAPKAALDDLMQALLEKPEFLRKPSLAEKQAGLKKYTNISDYPKEIVNKYGLLSIETTSRNNAGVFSKDSWTLANRLIDAAGTENAGKYSGKELEKIVAGATAKFEKIDQLVQLGITSSNIQTRMKSGERLSQMQQMKEPTLLLIKTLGLKTGLEAVLGSLKSGGR